MRKLVKHLSVAVATLVLAFQLTAGVVFSSLPVSFPVVATVAVVGTVAVTQVACSQDQLVSAGKDILSVVTDQTLQDYIRTLAPGMLTKFLALVPSAKDLIAAFQNGNITGGLALVNAIFPVIEEVAGVLINLSPPAMAILGLANIALHFILNHTKATTAAKAGRKAGVAAVRVADNYEAQKTWGCNYRADRRCAALAH